MHNVWGMLFGRGLRCAQRRRTRNLVKEFVHGRMESPNTSLQAIEFNPSCSGQAHSNMLGTDPPAYERTEPRCTVKVSAFHL